MKKFLACLFVALLSIATVSVTACDGKTDNSGMDKQQRQ